MSKTLVFKSLVDALKEGCLSDEDLRGIVKNELPKLSSDAVRKRVSRYLDELEKLGLVEERGGKYCWYIYVIDHKNREDYDVKLEHSRKMIPALRQIAGITLARDTFGPQEYIMDEDMRTLEECVEDHLRAYPEIWKLLEDYRKMKEEVKQEREMFYNALIEKMKKKMKKKPSLNPAKRANIKAS